jgi:hypothetical protein
VSGSGVSRQGFAPHVSMGRRPTLYDSRLWRANQRGVGERGLTEDGGCRNCVGFLGYSIPVRNAARKHVRRRPVLYRIVPFDVIWRSDTASAAEWTHFGGGFSP